MRALPVLLLLTACKRPEDPADGCGPLVVAGGNALTFDSAGCAAGDLALRVVGTGDLSARLEVRDDGSVVPVVEGSGELRALVLEGEVQVAGATDPVFWRQGYQSWSWSGVAAVEPMARDADDLPVVGGDADGLSVAEETPWSSWWVGLLGRDDGASVLLGATAARRTKWTVSTDGETVVAVWGGRGERLAVQGAEELDPMWLGVGEDAWALHTSYARAVAEETPPRPLRPRPPIGWATWTVYYEDIDEDVVLAELADAEAALGQVPEPRTFQLDDGWQVVWGDWTANADFPSGMDGVAAAISGAGFTPGLWMAPFYVDRSTATYQENPTWWVRDADGAELRFTNLGSGDYAVIDATHPDAVAWMAQQVADRVADGFTYLKLDFLYAGAQEGQRYADVTGTEALKLGLDAIREAVGEDAWILACGAPMLPSVGWAESFRSGADIAFTVQPDPDRDSLRWQARATAARGWQGGIWWHLDTDQILLRPPFGPDEQRAAVVAAAVSGGAWLLGDSVADIPPVGVAPAILDALGPPAAPEHPLRFVSGLDASPIVENAQQDDRAPQRWVFPDGRVALLNLTDDPVELEAPAGDEVLSGDALEQPGPRALAPWSGELWAPR